MTQAQLARFMAKVYKERSRTCWRWLGADNARGYGNLTQNGRTKLAHRVAYEHFIGPIPEHLEIDHICRNTRCVNPKHLEAVPHRVNCQRGNVGKWKRQPRLSITKTP